MFAKPVAWFITAHGFGHATRSLAVMAAWRALDPQVGFHIFSKLPPALLDQSIAGGYQLHPCSYDVGLVQKDALSADLDATCVALEIMIPFDTAAVSREAQAIQKLGCLAVVCDVVAFGIAVGKRAGVPTALLENFTWDWIYEAFLPRWPRLTGPIAYLREWYAQVDLHLQTEPVCLPVEGATTTGPISRSQRNSRAQTRAALGIAPERKLVMLTMGGVQQPLDYLARLADFPHLTFLMPGQQATVANLLPPSCYSHLHHPDLIAAADLVIAKLGYSTVAEVHAAGTPLVYVARAGFRESACLAHFAKNTLAGIECSEASLRDGSWLEQSALWTQLSMREPCLEKGANQAAQVLRQLIS